MQKMASEQKQVVILGAGYGGTALAKRLDSHFEVTLIEQKERFFHNVGSLRAAVKSDWLPKLFIPYDHLLQRGRLVHGTVNDVTPKDVHLETGETFPFDYLVLATGSSYPFPAKMPFNDIAHAHELVIQVNERIREARSILLIGAGPVGIEFAGEIASTYPGKRVTLIDVVPHILNQFNPKMGRLVQKDLNALGVTVILGESITPLPSGTNATETELLTMQTFVTDKGRTLEADLYFVCFGVQPNTGYLRSHLASSLDIRGFVKVNRFLQVEPYQHLFALGDVTNVKEAKMAYAADAQGKVVAENLKRLAQHPESPVTLQVYTPMTPPVAIIPVGPHHGAAQLPFGKQGFVLGAFAASRIKGKSLLAERYWQQLNASLVQTK